MSYDVIPTVALITGIASALLCGVLLLRILSTLPQLSAKAFATITLAITAWCILQSVLGNSGFYRNFESFPPRLFAFAVVPLLTLIAILVVVKKTRLILLGADLRTLTLIHVVRVPVELGLAQLAATMAVPTEMTYGGRNPDILIGITAPLAAYVFLRRSGLKRWPMIIWNLVSLASLIHIVSLAISATPYFTTHTAFAVANIAVFYFPWVLLPAFIVPAVLFAHVLSLIKLTSHSQ